jgi:hypothetical protein
VGEIVNLRRAKKQLARQQAAQAARENRALHGRSSAQKANDSWAAQRQRDELEGKRRDGKPVALPAPRSAD